MLRYTHMARGKTGVKASAGRSAATKRGPKKAGTSAAAMRLETPPNLRINHTFSERQLTALQNRTKKPQPGISITVQIPALKRPKPKAAIPLAPTELPGRRNRRALFFLVLPILIVAAAGTFYGIRHEPPKKAAAADASGTHRTAPNYQPLAIPSDKASTTSYDGQKNMVSYKTTYSGVRVTVSEQPIPESFSKDPTSLLRAADSMNAKQKIDTSHGTVFVATNEMGGDQMGLFANDQVLVFIHTDKKLDDVSWKTFVEQLQAESWDSLR